MESADAHIEAGGAIRHEMERAKLHERIDLKEAVRGQAGLEGCVDSRA